VLGRVQAAVENVPQGVRIVGVSTEDFYPSPITLQRLSIVVRD
jgi:hypothetical protein